MKEFEAEGYKFLHPFDDKHLIAGYSRSLKCNLFVITIFIDNLLFFFKTFCYFLPKFKDIWKTLVFKKSITKKNLMIV